MTLTRPRIAFGLTLVLALAGCQEGAPTAAPSPDTSSPPARSPYKPTATIQDLMQSNVDPPADFLWASVSTTVTSTGTEEHQPRTDEEWHEVRRQAVILMEAGNLLAMPGRRVALPGKKLEDEGIQGVLTADQAQAKIDSNHDTFVGFAQALHDVGEQMLTAIDGRNIQGMLDTGERIDEVCEACHSTFWYPNQVIPEFPD
jgi:hypothetical protein